jgi:hypothetical protein
VGGNCSVTGFGGGNHALVAGTSRSGGRAAVGALQAACRRTGAATKGSWQWAGARRRRRTMPRRAAPRCAALAFPPRFDGHTSVRASKLLLYLADMVVNGEARAQRAAASGLAACLLACALPCLPSLLLPAHSCPRA